MKKRKVLLVFLVILLICTVGCGFYLNDFYRASENAQQILLEEHENFEIVESEDDQIAFVPNDPIAGFIFYPGGKVEYEAYVPLMRELANQNILCVLVHMPFNLAVLDMNAANGIQEEYSEIDRWYIGGHSLGGAMASSYVESHQKEFEGLVLLAAYSTSDLSESDLQVISLYGSNDGVMNMGKYEENIHHLPSDYEEVIIEGGCHAGFGDYGAQDKDGTPTISTEKQIEITVHEIINYIEE